MSIPGRGRRRRRIGDCYLDSIAVCSALCYPVNKYRPGINKPLTSIGLCKDDKLVTIGVSFYRDHKDIVYINVHLNTSDTEETNTEIIVKLYEKLFVGCVYEHEDDKPVFFIPQSSEDMETKENSNFYTQMNTKSWYVDTNFMNRQKSTLSFLIYLPVFEESTEVLQER